MRELPSRSDWPSEEVRRQFELEFQRQVGDLVQEQRALVDQLDAAQALVKARSLLVAEHFAFKQPGRNRRAIQFDKSAVAAAG